MSDYCFIDFAHVIPVTGVELVDSITFRITAKDVTRVKRILLDGVEASEYVVTSRNSILVTIPASIRSHPISTVAILGDSNEASIISFNAKSLQQMNDSIYVLQKFFRLLFMRPGSNAFAPEEGAFLTSVIGNTDSQSTVQAQVVTKIKAAERQLKDIQQPEAADSKLLSVVNIENISYSVNTLSVVASITLVMVDGSTVTADFNTVG